MEKCGHRGSAWKGATRRPRGRKFDSGLGSFCSIAACGGAAGQVGDVAAVPGARAGQQVQPHVPAPPGQQAPPAAAHADRALLADARAHHQQDRLQRQGAHPNHHRTLRWQIRPAQRGLQRGLP